MKYMFYAETFEDHDIVGENLVESRFFSDLYEAEKFCFHFDLENEIEYEFKNEITKI